MFFKMCLILIVGGFNEILDFIIIWSVFLVNIIGIFIIGVFGVIIGVVVLLFNGVWVCFVIWYGILIGYCLFMFYVFFFIRF